MSRNNKKVFVMMSGGVDSSVAAFLLKKQVYDVVGVFMRCYNLDGCAERDAEDARRVAEKLNIPFYVWDFEKKYKKEVVEYMVKGYKKGITPNPDVMCNREIKFGLFLEKALKMGADYVASGHYVRLITSNQKSVIKGKLKIKNYKKPLISSCCLLIARDLNKDQSYFLWTLTQKQLKHCLFPIGDYLKSEVRKIARKAKLPTADKKDSQGICFLGKVSLGEFIGKYIPEKRGDVLNIDGEKIGEHKGAHFYTIGQRHIDMKFQIPKFKIQKNSKLQIENHKPYYVAEKDIKTNTLIMAEGSDNPALYRKEIELTDVNFFNSLILNTKYSILVMARVRYRQPLAAAELRIKNSEFKIIFDKPQKFVAPGQSAVFYYADGEMLGGGIIK